MRLNRLVVAAAALVVVGAGCDLAQFTPPGAAPLRYRDAIFTSVVKTTDVTYGSATNLENADGHAEARRLSAAGNRHGDEPPRDHLGARRIVQFG